MAVPTLAPATRLSDFRSATPIANSEPGHGQSWSTILRKPGDGVLEPCYCVDKSGVCGFHWIMSFAVEVGSDIEVADLLDTT